MKLKKILFLGLFAAMASFSNAQTSNFIAERPARVITGTPDSDPLGLFDDDTEEPKAAGVRSSVVVNMAASERAAFEKINQKRVESGLKPLVWSDELAKVARIHSQNMAEFKFFSHRGLDNKMVSDRADAGGIRKWRSIGENIAFNRGYADPVGMTIQLWLDSPSHRRNMLDSGWQESAIGVAKAEDGSIYFTQVFLVKK